MMVILGNDTEDIIIGLTDLVLKLLFKVSVHVGEKMKFCRLFESTE